MKAENVEIRGVEDKVNKKGEAYLIVRVDDEAGNRSEFVDRDIKHKKLYKRGTFGDLIVSVQDGKYWNVAIKEFIPRSQEQTVLSV